MPSKTPPHNPDDGVENKKKTTPKKSTGKKSSPQSSKKSPAWKSRGKSSAGTGRTSSSYREDKRTPEEIENVRRCLALTIFEETPEMKEERKKREGEKEMDDLNEELAGLFGLKRDRPGAPTKMDLSMLAKLLSAFSIGANDEEACCYAGIHPATFYRYKNKNPEFCEFVDTMKLKTPLKARNLLNKAFDDVENARLAYTYLRDRYPHEFSKWLSVFDGGANGGEGDSRVVNIIFAPNLWAPSFFDPSKMPE